MALPHRYTLSLSFPSRISVGVLVDLFGDSDKCNNRLDLLVRFRAAKRPTESMIDCCRVSDFPALFLNQIKLALTICGRGLSQFNILTREHIDTLQSIARSPDVSVNQFWEAHGLLFETSPGVAAVKLYVCTRSEVFSTVIAVPLLNGENKTTVGDILREYDLKGVITQGVVLFEETPIHFLQSGCMYADGFVHLVSFTS